MGRQVCPSCQSRLTPLALECPVCGLPLSRGAHPRPLLFQASALTGKPLKEVPGSALAAPALGRIGPVEVPGVPAEPEPLGLETAEPVAIEAFEPPPASSSFLMLARLEVLEALLLAGLNGLVLLVVWLSAQAPLGRIYGELWHLLLVLHLALSWALFLIPVTLVGQSPLMGRFGLVVDAELPERRLAFSLFHLVAVVLFPVSFLCMVLTPAHRTLAEWMTGQEILLKAWRAGRT